MSKEEIKKIIQDIEASPGETPISGTVRRHALRIIDWSNSFKYVFQDVSVTTGGNGTIMILWDNDKFMATLDIGHSTHTESIIEKETHKLLLSNRVVTVDREPEVAYFYSMVDKLLEPQLEYMTDDMAYANKYSSLVWDELMYQFKKKPGQYPDGFWIGANDVSDIVLNAILDTLNGRKFPVYNHEEEPADECCNDCPSGCGAETE